LDAPYRLVISSRNEKISVDNNSYIRPITNELSDYNFLNCKVHNLNYSQINNIIAIPRNFPQILKNNKMLSMYMNLLSEDIGIGPESICGGIILDKYMDEYVREKARRYLNKCDDSDTTQNQISDADEKINEVYKILLANSFSSSIPIKTFHGQLDLIDAIGILIRNGENYVWADEFYQCYFMCSMLYLIIKFGSKIFKGCIIDKEIKDLNKEQSELLLTMIIAIKEFITNFHSNLIEKNSSYSFQMLYDTIQYTGEMLLNDNKEAFETLIRVHCNSAEFLVFTSTLFYLISQNHSDSFHIPQNFCNVIFCGMFAECETLHRIHTHPSVTLIDDFAFAGCENLNDVVLGENLNKIGQQSFSLCTSLTSISIPANVSIIGEAAFERCKSLTNVYISDGVQEIGLCAFYECISLKEIFIPQSVIKMNSGVFLKCESLTDIYCEAEEQPIGWDNHWLTCDAIVHWGAKR